MGRFDKRGRLLAGTHPAVTVPLVLGHAGGCCARYYRLFLYVRVKHGCWWQCQAVGWALIIQAEAVYIYIYLRDWEGRGEWSPPSTAAAADGQLMLSLTSQSWCSTIGGAPDRLGPSAGWITHSWHAQSFVTSNSAADCALNRTHAGLRL